jgi:hypothetical protein
MRQEEDTPSASTIAFFFLQDMCALLCSSIGRFNLTFDFYCCAYLGIQA